MSNPEKTVTLSVTQIQALLQLVSKITGGVKEAPFLLVLASAAQVLEAALQPPEG